MNEKLVQLTLVLPRDLRDDLVEILLEHEPLAEGGFATRDVDAHGLALSFRSIAEQIRGRVRQTEVTAQLTLKDARAVITLLQETAPTWGIRYRLSPLTEAGEITAEVQPDQTHD